MKQKTLAIILAVSVSLNIVGCTARPKTEAASEAPAQPPSTSASAERQRGYVARFANTVMFTQFVDNGGQLSGQFQIAQTDSQAVVSSQNYPFTGTRSGKDVSFTLTGSVWTTGWTAKTLTGTLSGSELALVMPGDDGNLSTVVFKVASVDDFNKQVSVDRQAAIQQQQARQAAEASVKAAQDAADERLRQQRAVASANEEVATVLHFLASNRDTLADYLQFDGIVKTGQGLVDGMRAQFAGIQQKSAKPLTCYERSQLDYEVSQIDYTLSQIDYLKSQADSVRSGVAGQVQVVRDDIQRLQRAWDKLQAATSANTTGIPTPAYRSDQIEAATQAANEKVIATSASMQQQLANVADVYKQGQGVLATAKKFMTGVKCSN